MPDTNLIDAQADAACGSRPVTPAMTSDELASRWGVLVDNLTEAERAFFAPHKVPTPNYADADAAIADLTLVKALRDELEAFDQRLLHSGLSDAADGFEAPAYIDNARVNLDAVRNDLNLAVKSAEDAVAWMETNDAEDRRGVYSVEGSLRHGNGE